MRVDYREAFPAGVQAMAGLERAVGASTLEPELLELVRIRASQINGCTYCLAMHNRDARARGERATRLDTVTAWREAPFFTARERAALAWCEALTDLPRTGAPDDVFAAAEAEFSREEIAALTFAIVAINGWNRLAVGLRSDVMSLDGLALPADAGQPAGTGERDLDVRTLAPAQRHEAIFAAYRSLAPGAGFVLVNDHDPKPLRYQFEAEHAGEFSWDYLESGPERWRVRIGRPRT